MKTFTRLSALCCAIMVALPAVSPATGRADNPDHAACRDQALAEGLRSEEVILDFIFECVQSQSAANASGIPDSGISSDAAAGTAKTPRRSPAAGVDR
jgi:hypothetical protein